MAVLLVAREALLSGLKTKKRMSNYKTPVTVTVRMCVWRHTRSNVCAYCNTPTEEVTVAEKKKISKKKCFSQAGCICALVFHRDL